MTIRVALYIYIYIYKLVLLVGVNVWKPRRVKFVLGVGLFELWIN